MSIIYKEERTLFSFQKIYNNFYIYTFKCILILLSMWKFAITLVFKDPSELAYGF